MTQQTMPKKRSTYMIEEDLITAMKAMAGDQRWSFSTMLEVALERILKENDYLDESGKLTQKAIR